MILADHCVFAKTVRELRAHGVQVATLKELGATALADPDVLALAAQHDLVLLTNDKGFGNILRYPPGQHGGIIVLDIEPMNETSVHRVLLRLLQDLTRKELRQSLVVVDAAKYRIRR